MPETLTTTTEIDSGVMLFYERTLLKTPYPQYVHNKFAERYSIPSGSSRTVKMRRYSRFAAATTPLAEGIRPSGKRMVKVDILATVQQYGDWVNITDVVLLTVPDKVITKAVELQSDQMKNTLDQLTRDILGASASSTTCTNGDPTVTYLNKIDIDSVVQTLIGNTASYITKLVKAGAGQGTSPIAAAFAGILHTDLIDDIERVTGFKGTHLYANQGLMDDQAEYGATGKVRWLLSTQGYTSSSNYYLPIIAKDAYASIDIAGGNAKSMITPPGGHGDELRQSTGVSWKMWQIARIVQDLFIHNLICTNRS